MEIYIGIDIVWHSVIFDGGNEIEGRKILYNYWKDNGSKHEGCILDNKYKLWRHVEN